MTDHFTDPIAPASPIEPASAASATPRLQAIRLGIAELWADFVGLVALLSLGVAVAMIAGAWFPVVDAINQFAPVWFAGTLLALVITLTIVKRAKISLLMAAIAVVLAGSRVMPELYHASLQRLPTIAPTAETPVITVVTFNMWGGIIDDPAPLAHWIAAQKPDFALLQEVSGKGEDVMKLLSEDLPYRVNCRRTTAGCMGVILSDYPADPYVPAPEGAQSRWADGRFTLPSGVQLGLLSAHTAWAINQPLTLPFPKATSQVRQFGLIARQVRALGSESTILTGDFNSGGWTFGLQRLEQESGLIRHTRALFSWPAVTVWRGHPRFPIVPIDHMMAGKHWRLVSIKRGPALGSDHYPLVAKFAWVGPKPTRSSRIQPNVEARR